MPRDNPISVRFDDYEEKFLENMAAKDVRPVATLVYIAVREYMKTHGYQDWLVEHKRSVDRAKLL